MNANEKLSFFLELVGCNHALHYWHYNAEMSLLETDWPGDLLSDDFFDSMGMKETILRHLADGNTKPLILEAESNLLWLIGFCLEKESLPNICLIGPILGGRDTRMVLLKKLDSYELSVKLRITICRMLEEIPAIPSNTLIRYAVMLHYCLTHEKISSSDVVMLNSGFPRLPENPSFQVNSHAGVWVNEQLLCKMFADGDSRYKEVLTKSHSLSHGLKVELGDSLRSTKNNCLVLLTLCSRACINGGLPPEIGYDLNDFYAQKIESCKSITDATDLCSEMLEDYVGRVQEIKTNVSISNSVRICCEYIKNHLTESISIEELAKRAGYTEYYFSHKFKKEMGCSVNDYILKEKIEQAKLRLSATMESIQSISDSLDFGNRSYFYSCFQKVVGMSPTEYRKRN